MELMYGINTIQTFLDSNPREILYVYITRRPWMPRLKCLAAKIVKYNICMQECDRSYLDFKVKGAVHQGIIAKIVCKNRIQECDLLNFLKQCIKTMPLLLILDSITDPRNFGACLRTADAAGVHLVIAPRNRSACINDTVRKVASGSADRIPFLQVTNLSRTLRLLQKNNIWIIGTVIQSSKIIFNCKLIGPLAFVMGSESSGIRHLIRQNCDELVSIPILEPSMSLNVAVATGICLFEALRQRKV